MYNKEHFSCLYKKIYIFSKTFVVFKKTDWHKGITGIYVKKHSVFILIAILVVVGVAGIFRGVAFPVEERVVSKVPIGADKRRLKYLVTWYLLTVASGQLDLTNVRDIVGLAVALAKEDGPKEVFAYQSVKRENK